MLECARCAEPNASHTNKPSHNSARCAAALIRMLVSIMQPIMVFSPALRAADRDCCATFAEQPLIQGDWLKPGTHLDLEVTVEHQRRQAAATVVKLPFFDPPRKRA